MFIAEYVFHLVRSVVATEYTERSPERTLHGTPDGEKYLIHDFGKTKTLTFRILIHRRYAATPFAQTLACRGNSPMYIMQRYTMFRWPRQQRFRPTSSKRNISETTQGNEKSKRIRL